MITKVKKYIEELNLLSRNDRVVIGVSGGADSMCLLSVLLSLKEEYNLTLFVIHVNHNIRGSEAKADEEFVVNYCTKNDVHVTVVSKDVKILASEHGWSEEEAGRNVRYDAFYKECEENKCNKIAIAHNKNDNAETILFHLLRGSGIDGMRGIRPRREKIIRPLLNTSRFEIENYVKVNNIPYHVDATNLLEDYTRNKIRLTMLPFAEREINAKAMEHIVSMAEQLTEVADYIHRVTMSSYKDIVSEREPEIEIDLIKFKSLELVIQKSLLRKVIFLWIKQLKDIQEGHIMDIIALTNKQVGKYIHLPYGIIVRKTYHSIVFSKEDCEQNLQNTPQQKLNISVQIPGAYSIDSCGYTIFFELFEYKKSMRIPKNGYTKWFDYDKIKTAVVIRTRQIGDYLQIGKQGGNKSLKSVFVDNKIPSDSRDKIPLICDGSHVLWILGGRNSEGYHIDDETKTVLVIRVEQMKTDDGKVDFKE